MRRLYVLVSNELSPVYGCVQAGHAVAQWLLEHKDSGSWKNEYLIYLYADLKEWKQKLQDKDISCFKEPDLDNKLTAIALVSDGSIFRNLKLVS